MSRVSEAASWLMYHLITHYTHGYSQPNRLGDGTLETVDIPEWGKVTIAGGDRDCSSACIGIYKDLGIDVGYATYTGNERQGLVSTGLFTSYRVGSVTVQDGDILLRSGHTEMVINDARWQAGFRRSENHSITGKTGDQDGYESTYSTLDLTKWTWVIRYTGPDKTGPGSDKSDSGASKSVQVKEDVVTDADIEKTADKVIERMKAETNDPTGRGYDLNIFDHVKWIAAAVADTRDSLKKLGEDVAKANVTLSKVLDAVEAAEGKAE